jgi:hypothetical protein
MGGMTCQSGDCRCPAGQQDCGGTCVSLTDPSHCGMCGMSCRADQICTGSCQCPFPLTDCGGACVDTRFDLDHCGGCGIACDPVSETCSPGGVGSSYYCVCRSGYFDCGGDGVCEDLQTDEAHCGFCGNDCHGMQQCTGGTCG